MICINLPLGTFCSLCSQNTRGERNWGVSVYISHKINLLNPFASSVLRSLGEVGCIEMLLQVKFFAAAIDR